jgi:DNA polymerase I-like protein with 3'-5' exonuclease and polymerase domains
MEGNIAQQILAWMARRNRRGVLTSWLAHPRLAIDQRLPAGAAGITNTHRQRHTVVVNVPQADGKAIYGKEMRSLFIAPPGYVCVGIDASGLENRIAGHYTTPFDGGAYARVLLEGDTHAVNAAAYSAAIGREVSRHESKPITYGTIYGAGPKKVSVMLNVSLAIAKLMTEAFWRANPGLLAYRKHLEQEWERNGRAFIYGLDGRHIRTRSKHSLINAAFQSCGAIVMDRAWAIAKPLLAGFEYQRWGYFHDEYQIYARPEEADRLGQIVVDSIKQAGEYYQLNVPLTGEYKIGKTWGDTH